MGKEDKELTRLSPEPDKSAIATMHTKLKIGVCDICDHGDLDIPIHDVRVLMAAIGS